MDLQQLRDIGAFKDRNLVKRLITVSHFPQLPKQEWDSPDVPVYGDEKVEHSFDVFIRKRSSADAIEIARADVRFTPHYAVWRCVVNEKGDQIFPSLDDVLMLEEWMLLPLFNAVGEVNAYGPKHSPLKTKPGATSRSPSGVAVSRNGKKNSRRMSGRSGPSTGPSTAP